MNNRLPVECRGSYSVGWHKKKYTEHEGDQMNPSVNIAVLGASGTGKTALCVRFLTNRFIGEYSSCSDQSYNKTVSIEGKLVNLTVLDTCKYPAESKLYELSLWGHGFLIVFSLTDSFSLLKAQAILQALFKLAPCSPCILLANKSDLLYNRRVSTQAAMTLSVRNGSSYMEVSAAGLDFTAPCLAFTSIARLALAVSASHPSPNHLHCFGLLSIWMSSWWRKKRRKRSFRFLESSVDEF